MNTSCCLATDSNGNVLIKAYTGAPEQIWNIENLIVYDSNNDASPSYFFKQYGKDYVIDGGSPSREGYQFIGWSYSADAEEPEIAVGDIYDKNENLYLYAVWKEAEMLGDVNDDGAIDQYDYILVKRHYFETRELMSEEFVRGDVNIDGKVDQFDYILIARHYFGTYTIGETTTEK